MNQIERVKEGVERMGFATTLDPPLRRKTGASWMLFVRAGERLVVVEWRSRRGFGVSLVTGETGLEGPQEIVSSPAATISRVAELLESGEPQPVESVSLADLRRLEKLSQGELAKRLKVTQATVSELEAKGIDTAAVATVKRAVEALGMRLELRAVRDGGRFFVLRGLDDRSGFLDKKTRA